MTVHRTHCILRLYGGYVWSPYFIRNCLLLNLDLVVGVLLFEVPQVDRSHAARYRYITPPRYCSTANETAHVAVLIWRI